MTIADAIAACGTEHVGAGAHVCRACKATKYPCREALRAAAEYALRDAEAWRRVAVEASARVWETVDNLSLSQAARLIVGKEPNFPGDTEAIATEAHRIVLAQMEEERKRG